MANMSSLSMVDQAAQIHRPDCASFGPTPAIPIAPLPEGVDDGVIAYGLQARPIYSALKRVIGQVAGLLILLEASGRREALDLPSLASVEETWNDLSDSLAALRSPARLDRHQQQLMSARRLLGTCLAALRQQQDAVGRPDMTIALGNLAAAYRHLQSASEDRFGMTMVDFRHSCCNCGSDAS